MSNQTPETALETLLKTFSCQARPAYPSFYTRLPGANTVGLNPTDLDKRLADQFQKRQAAERLMSVKDAAIRDARREQLYIRHREVDRMTQTVALGPEVKRDSMNAVLARDWAVARQWLGMGDRYTVEGWTRANIVQSRRLFEGGMADLLARMEVNDRLAAHANAVEPIRRELKISRHDWGIITSWAVEDGFHPYAVMWQQLNPIGQQRLAQRHSQLIQFMRDKGLSDPQIQTMLDHAREVASLYDEVATAAESMGVTIDRQDIIGYITRASSEDAIRRFNWKWLDEQGQLEWNDGTRSSVEQMFQKSRNTFEFAVEDEALLDFTFREVIRQQTNQGVDITPLKDLYNSVGGIRGLITNERTLSQMLVQTLTDAQIQALVDTGIITKLPMNTYQVFQYLQQNTKAFAFPFKGIDEVFAVDWNVGMRVYQDSLIRATGNSGMVNLTLTNAINGKWGISGLERAADMETFGEFIQFTKVFPPNVRGAFGLAEGQDSILHAPRTLERLGFSKMEAARLNELSDVYVHPLVAEFLRAEMDILTNPQGMGVFAHTVSQYNTAFRFMATSSGDYVFKQMYSSLLQTQAAGGNLFMWGDKMQKRMRMLLAKQMGKDPLDVLDNTHRIYVNNTLTERELYKELQARGVLGQFESLMSGEQPGRYRNFRMSDAGRYTYQQLRNIYYTFREYGVFAGRTYPRVAAQLSDLFVLFTTTLGHVFRMGNSIADDIGRFTTIASTTTEQTLPNLAGQLTTSLSRKHFTNLDEAIDHMTNYFYFYDDLGAKNKFISRYVVPFWTFRSKNLPAMIRHAIRNPARYMAYVRTLAFIQTQLAGDDQYLIKNAIPDWLSGEAPITFNAGDTDGDGEDNYFIMPSTGFNPAADMDKVLDGANWLLHRLGIWNDRSVSADPAKAPWDSTQSNDVGQAVVDNTYRWWSGAVAALFGELRGTGFDVGNPWEDDSATFLGQNTSRMTKFLLESNLPILRTINRFNFGGLAPFGAPAQYDSRTGQMEQPPIQSVFGVTPRGAGAQQNDYRVQVTLGDLVRSATNNNADVPLLDVVPTAWVGLNFYPLDVARNIGMDYDQIQYSIRDGVNAVRRKRINLQNISDRDLYEREVKEIIEYENILRAMVVDYGNLQSWMQQNRIPSAQWVTRMRRSNTDFSTLPQAHSEEEYDIIYRSVYEGRPIDEAFQQLEQYQQQNGQSAP